MNESWGIRSIAHPALRDVRDACGECLDLADSAVVHARVTGSTGCTYQHGDHEIVVVRLIAVVEAP